MSLKSRVDTNVNLESQYSDSSINDSVFFSGSISADVITLVCLIVVILLVIFLYLHSLKKISVIESEIVVILRILKRSQTFDESTIC